MIYEEGTALSMKKDFTILIDRSEPVHDDLPQGGGSLERIVICYPAAKPCYTTPILRPSVFVWILTKFEVGLKMLIGPNIFFTVGYRITISKDC